MAIDPTTPKRLWFVTWCVDRLDPHSCSDMRHANPIGTFTFEAMEPALEFLEKQRKAGANWGKCYAYRDTDGRYLYEAEFQQRT